MWRDQEEKFFFKKTIVGNRIILDQKFDQNHDPFIFFIFFNWNHHHKSASQQPMKSILRGNVFCVTNPIPVKWKLYCHLPVIFGIMIFALSQSNLIGIGLRDSSGEYHFDTWLPFSLFYVMDFSQSQSNPTGIGLTTLSLKIPSKTLKKENWSSRNNHRNKNRLMSENVGIICLFYRILVVFQFWSISLQKYSKNMNFCVYY